MKHVGIIFAFVALAACATHRQSDYERWAAQLPPASWTTGSTWTFAITDKKQQLVMTMTVILTDKKGQSCNGGDWRHVEILSRQPPPHPRFLGVPAYKLKGRAFIMDLTANLCDAYTELRGELTETGVVGVYSAGGMFDGEDIGEFYGVHVAGSPAPNKAFQRTLDDSRR